MAKDERRTVYEPARETEVFDRCEVLVVGGGPAGVAAAVAAPLFFILSRLSFFIVVNLFC